MKKKQLTVDDHALEFRAQCKRSFAIWLSNAVKNSKFIESASDLERLAAQQFPEPYQYVRQHIHAAMQQVAPPTKKPTIPSVEFAITMALLLRLPVEEGLQAAGYRVPNEFAQDADTSRIKMLWNAMSGEQRHLTVEIAEVLWNSAAALETQSSAENELLQFYREAGEREKALLQNIIHTYRPTMAPISPQQLPPRTPEPLETTEDDNVEVAPAPLDSAQTVEQVRQAITSLPESARSQIEAALKSVENKANATLKTSKRNKLRAVPDEEQLE